jgi:16S rRNA (uracil1498-N3)-methyltransferase
MKALYCDDPIHIELLNSLTINAPFSWTNVDDLHHLLRVCRLHKNEEVLFLNGKGRGVIAKFQGDHKFKRADFIVLDLIVSPLENSISIKLVIGKIKKPALEQVVVDAVEMGVSHMAVVDTQYSQAFTLKSERTNTLMKNAYQQSNRLKAMELSEGTDFESYLRNWQLTRLNSDVLILFDQSGDAISSLKLDSNAQRVSLLIGPEGGWSLIELEIFHKLKNDFGSQVFTASFATPILRAPTAVVMAVGAIHGKLTNSEY